MFELPKASQSQDHCLTALFRGMRPISFSLASITSLVSQSSLCIDHLALPTEFLDGGEAEVTAEEDAGNAPVQKETALDHRHTGGTNAFTSILICIVCTRCEQVKMEEAGGTSSQRREASFTFGRARACRTNHTPASSSSLPTCCATLFTLN